MILMSDALKRPMILKPKIMIIIHRRYHCYCYYYDFIIIISLSKDDVTSDSINNACAATYVSDNQSKKTQNQPKGKSKERQT